MKTRRTIASTKVVKGLDTFNLANLKELANFYIVEVTNAGTGKTLGYATKPKVTRTKEGWKLTAILELNTPEILHFSVGYRVTKGVYDKPSDTVEFSDLKLCSVISTRNNLHD